MKELQINQWLNVSKLALEIADKIVLKQIVFQLLKKSFNS